MYPIEIENLVKKYNSFTALDGVTIMVEERDIFGFLGPNGAGKTTTINCTLALIKPTSGRIRVCGIDVEENPVKVKEVCGYLPENCGLYGNLTARQNLLYFSEFYPSKDHPTKDSVDEILNLVGLGEVADKKVSEFSRGMKQRLALAQALIHDPEVIFLDEPTNGLDPQGIADFRKIIRKLNGEGKTIFYSSHILSEVKETCKSIGIINKGKIVAIGRISEFKTRMEIQVQTDPPADESILKKFGDVRFDDEKNVYIVEVERDCRVELSKALFENGYILKELHLSEPSLEDIYLKLVG